MKKIDLSQVIGIAANVGVIVGIGFLVVEVGQNTAALQNEADVAIWSMGSQTAGLVAETPELAELLVRARSEPWREFSDVEQFRIELIWDNTVSRFELQYRMYKRNGDVLQRGDWLFPESLLGQGSFNEWWGSWKGAADPEFREYLDSFLEQ
jgi:hypothetical protein